MTIIRGEVWLADLNPTRGSEQGGTRPVIIFQNNIVPILPVDCIFKGKQTSFQDEWHDHQD